jgi:cytochrome c oxidase subunit 1
MADREAEERRRRQRAKNWALVAVLFALVAGRQIGANPWGEGATTLEWSVSSPPPFHSYEELPRVR